MVGWAAVEFDMLISTPGKVLCLHRFLPCHHPCSASCRLPPGTGGTCAREQTRPTPGHSSLWFWETADQAANGGCYSLCRSWCMELGGCLDLGARQRQVSEWCPRTETVQCLCSTASHQSAHQCPHPTLQHPGSMFPPLNSNQMVFREQKHLKCVCCCVCSTQERVNLCWEGGSWCRSCSAQNSKVVTAAAPAESSPAVQAVGSRLSYMFSFKGLGLQCLHLPKATHGAMSALHKSPERDCDARKAYLSTFKQGLHNLWWECERQKVSQAQTDLGTIVCYSWLHSWAYRLPSSWCINITDTAPIV